MAINQTFEGHPNGHPNGHPIRTFITHHALVVYFGLTYLLCWLCWVPLVLFLPGGFQPGGAAAGASHPSLLFFLFPLGNIAPSVVGVLLTVVLGGRKSLRALFGQVGRWRVSPGWYAVALFLTPLVTAGALALYVALGGSAPASSVMAIAGAALGGAIFAALGEEFGWRGFALPRLLAQRTAFGASIVLGLLWGFWHVPRWIWGTTASPAQLIPAIALQVLTLTAFAVLMTWVYSNTRRSLLLMILFHASIAATSYYPFPQQATTATGWEQTLLVLGLLWMVVLGVVLVYGPRRLTRSSTAESVPQAAGAQEAGA